MSLKYLSTYRSQLMAFAIFGVLFVHSLINIPCKLIQSYVGMGYGGVDLFFFLSGFGLFFSCNKDCRVLRFWWKRLKRILPSFFVCLVLVQLMRPERMNWTKIWHSCVFIGYWIKSLHWEDNIWFIPGIMGLYLIFPFYFRFFKRYPRGATVHATLIGLFFAELYSYYFLILHPGGCNSYIHLFARTPIFFLGVYTGWLYNREKTEGKQISTNWFMLVLLFVPFGREMLAIVTHLGMSYNTLRNAGGPFYPFIFITPGLAIGLSYVISVFPKVLNKALAYIGNSTLEAYCLIHGVYHFKPQFVQAMWGNDMMGSLLMMLACIVTAIIVHYVVQKLVKYLDEGFAFALKRCRGEE